MRLTPDQIKQGINHSARSVRNACLAYFVDSFSSDPDVMPLVIQAIEKYGWDDAFDMDRVFGDLAQTEDTVVWAIDQLQRRGRTQNEDATTSWLLETLLSADPNLIQIHVQRIQKLDAVNEDLQEVCQEQFLLRSFSPERLWRELEEFCQDNKSGVSLSVEDVDFSYRLIEAMGRHPAVFDGKVLELLAQNVKDYTNDPMKWMEPCIVRLAGELRLQSAIPLLVNKLHDDDEILAPECIRSLARIGTDEVVDALANEFRKHTWPCRVHIAGLFGRIHSDRCVEQCLALSEGEDNLVVQCRLVRAALKHFADDAIEAARQLVLNTELTPDVIDVRNDLLVASELMGVELPERDWWQEQAKHDVAFEEKWYAERFEGGGDGKPEYPAEGYDDDVYDPLPPSATVVHEGPQTGRNEPCPCGSGKKYKKCCLKKQ